MATPARAIGLYSTLPIAWNEADDVGALLADKAPPHWALAVLAKRGTPRALDTLAGADGALPLPADGLLVLAQPRVLSPAENLALDTWVRAGGRVLLFADPMLTGETIFAPGDPRRPQDVALLSPILKRWGLVLEVDDTAPPGERTVPLGAVALPVNLPGQFRSSPDSGADGDGGASCAFLASRMVAQCAVGRGRVVAVADAAVMENPQVSGDSDAARTSRRAAFADLIDRTLSAR